jgi:hypothetical protein
MKKISPKIALPVVCVLALVAIAMMVFIASKKTDVEILDAPKSLTTTTTDSNPGNGNSPDAPDEFVLPNGWKTVKYGNVTLALPVGWRSIGDADLYTDQYQSKPFVVVEAPILDGVVKISDRNSGFRYSKDVRKFVNVNGNKGSKKSSLPVDAPWDVSDADSTILLESGEGDCISYKIGFAKDEQVYSISLPQACIADKGNKVISQKEAKSAIENIIKSVKIVDVVANSDFDEIG